MCIALKVIRSLDSIQSPSQVNGKDKKNYRAKPATEDGRRGAAFPTVSWVRGVKEKGEEGKVTTLMSPKSCRFGISFIYFVGFFEVLLKGEKKDTRPKTLLDCPRSLGCRLGNKCQR
jgi:hypothetical protein